MSDQRTLAQRLLAVRHAIKAVDKDGENPHHKFKYASIAGVLAAVRPHLDEHGVLLLPSVTETKTEPLGKQILCHVWLTYTFINADNINDRYTVNWYGAGTDPGERCAGKAYSYALKTFLLSALQLPTDDEADAGPSPVHNGYEPRSNGGGGMCSSRQKSMMWALANKAWPGLDRDTVADKLRDFTTGAGFPGSADAMSVGQASTVIKSLKTLAGED